MTDADHSQMMRAEMDNKTPRTSFAVLAPGKPGADLLFQSTAAFAASAVALRNTGSPLAKKAEVEAKKVYAQAAARPGIYSVSVPEAGKTYKSEGWEQYGFWAAAWMYKMTGESKYKQVRHFQLYTVSKRFQLATATRNMSRATVYLSVLNEQEVAGNTQQDFPSLVVGVQDAEKYMSKSGGKQWWSDHSWASVYMGACAVMWEETGESRYTPFHSQ